MCRAAIAAVLVPCDARGKRRISIDNREGPFLWNSLAWVSHKDFMPVWSGVPGAAARARTLLTLLWTHAGSNIMGGGIGNDNETNSSGSIGGDSNTCGGPNSVRRSQRKSVTTVFREFLALHSDDIPFVRQSYSWDCGLACVEMALRARGLTVTVGELRRLCDTDSVWSIDLSYLLRRFGVDLTYYTITTGVREEYQQQEFYRKQLLEDTKRVTALFEGAEREGIHVIDKAVDVSDIVRAISVEHRIVIVLVDKRLMRCRLCSSELLSKSADSRFTSFGSRYSSSFLGHYVVLYAYDVKNDLFLMKDPAASRKTCAISSVALDEARKAFGTDQDIIYVGEICMKQS